MGHRRQPCSHAPDRFNAATTRRPWRTLPFFLYTPNTNELQCGHDPKAVENFSECVRDAKGHCASMRPRPEGRGEPQDRLEQVLHFRLQCGHDPKAVENEAYHHEEGAGTVMLQCGHDPKAVENHGSIRARHAGSSLQCGHDPKAVENVSSPSKKASMP